MSESKLFCKSRTLLFFMIFVFGLLSPLSLFAGQRLLDRLTAKVSEYQGIVNTEMSRLNSCRSTCVSQCRDSCISQCQSRCGERNNCGCANERCAQCNEGACDAGSCSSQKSSYNKYKAFLDQYQTELASLRSQEGDSSEGSDENQDENENPELGAGGVQDATITQVRKGKKKVSALSYLGVATTGFLGWQAAKCCSICSASSSGACCDWCPVLIGFTAAAGLQTAELFKGKSKLESTEVALCEAAPSAQGCAGAGNSNADPNAEGDDGPNPNLPPSCQAFPGSQCDELLQVLEPPEPPSGGTLDFWPTDDMTGNLASLFKPEEGWPEGAFDESTGFEYDKLSPQQKKRIDALVAKANNKNKGFLANALGDDAGEDAGEDAGVQVAEELVGKGKSDTGSFTGGKGAVSSLSGSSGVSGSPRKKVDLAQQMKNLLKKFRKNGGKDPLAKKSVSFGSDVVGVVEDNIFMMVHRRHRALDDQNFFIKNNF